MNEYVVIHVTALDYSVENTFVLEVQIAVLSRGILLNSINLYKDKPKDSLDLMLMRDFMSFCNIWNVFEEVSCNLN